MHLHAKTSHTVFVLPFKVMNKFIYAHIGAGEVLKRLCDVPFPITLHCDGKEV